MVEILDKASALDDPLFLEIWEGINLKKQLEEAHRQLSIAISMPDTVQKTYLVLIDNYHRELEGWFLEDPDENYYQKAYKELEQIGQESGLCKDALEAIELHKKFKEAFARIVAEGDLENRYIKRWGDMERRTRDLVRTLTKFLLEGSARVLEINEEILRCEENYETLRLGVIHSAENQLVKKMTKRFQKMRLDFLHEICRQLQTKHEQVCKQQAGFNYNTVRERQHNRRRVDELKSELRKLRIQYYTEPIELEQGLEKIRDQVMENDQKIALLTAELKHLSEEMQQVDPVSSLKPEVSARQTPIYDIPERPDEKSAIDMRKIARQLEEEQQRLEDEAPENEIIMIDVPKRN